jgi:hypothetical protein
VATAHHPFWVPQLHRWVDATDLQSGQWLQTSAGTWVQITADQKMMRGNNQASNRKAKIGGN